MSCVNCGKKVNGPNQFTEIKVGKRTRPHVRVSRSPVPLVEQDLVTSGTGDSVVEGVVSVGKRDSETTTQVAQTSPTTKRDFLSFVRSLVNHSGGK